MKELEIIVATLDEQNLSNQNVEMEIMLEGDDYNDLMYMNMLTQYDVLNEEY